MFHYDVYNFLWYKHRLLKCVQYAKFNDPTIIKIHMIQASCDNVAISDFKIFDISGRRLRLHRISAMAQQREWFTPAVFQTFPNLLHEK